MEISSEVENSKSESALIYDEKSKNLVNKNNYEKKNNKQPSLQHTDQISSESSFHQECDGSKKEQNNPKNHIFQDGIDQKEEENDEEEEEEADKENDDQQDDNEDEENKIHEEDEENENSNNDDEDDEEEDDEEEEEEDEDDDGGGEDENDEEDDNDNDNDDETPTRIVTGKQIGRAHV